jgi:predicted permease
MSPPRWRRYLRFWRSNIRADVDEELAFHVAEKVDELTAAGMDPQAAREEALRRFGDMTRVKETLRHLAQQHEARMTRAALVSVAKQDARYALRMLRAAPAATAAIILTLALGIGATTAIYSVVHAVLLRPMPYADSDRLMMVFERVGAGRGSASPGHFADWTEKTSVFEATSAYVNRTYALTDGDATRILGAMVSTSFFQTGYIKPAAGRYFLPTETNASRVVVLSYPLWQARFAGDPGIVGRDITLNGERHTVVGVTPPAYTLTPQDEMLWTILSFRPEDRANYGQHYLQVFALLRPGVTFEQAQADLERVTADIRRQHPDQMENRGVQLASFNDIFLTSSRTQLWVLFAAVTLVLLIGCGNVASLLLARAASRRREMAVRSALGGSRRRLVAQLLTESAVLAAIGGLASLAVARLGIAFLVGTGPTWVPRLRDASLNLPVLVFAFLLTLACGILFGLAPALRITRPNLQADLREGGRGGAVVRERARALLSVAQVAVALVLLVSAGLFLRSAERLTRVPLGFAPRDVTMMRVALPAARYGAPPEVEGAFGRMLEQVRAIPGVTAVAGATRVPMWGSSVDIGVRVDGKATTPANNVGHVRLVTPGYTEILGIPVKAGRPLQESDMQAGAPLVVLVNETFARNVLGPNPLGQRISGWTSSDDPIWREVVGVVGDVRSFGRENDAPPEIFFPWAQRPDSAWNAFQRSVTLLAQTGGSGMILAPALRKAVASVDPLVPLWDVQTMDDVLAQAGATRRFNTLLLSLLGATGLVLAAIGIYGVIAYFVTQRTQEIGLRMALGATSPAVIRLVVRQAAVLVLTGIVVGGLASAWVTRVLETMLFQVSARDPLAYGVAAGVLLAVALAAAWLPARRAARVDPVQALGTAG